MKLEASSNCSEFTIVFSFSARLSKSQASYQLTASSNCWSTTIFADCDELRVVKPADDHDGGYTLVDIVGTIPDDESKSKKLLNWLIDLLRWQALEEQDRFTNETNKAPPVKGQLYYCCDYVPLSTIGKLLMQPLAASQQHKSDVALIMNGLPVIQFEINSSPISTTVAKLFANLVDVLRFIRHFDLKINTWTGFAFPKVKVDSSNNYAFKVGVRWKNLQFAPEVSALKLRDIAQEVKDTFNMQVDLVQKLYVSEDEVMRKEMYLVPLSDADIDYCATALQPSSVIEQVESPFSILLCDGSCYYKYSPKSEVRETLFALLRVKEKGSLLSSNLILPHDTKRISDLVFFVFHAVKYNNLSKAIAKTCLGELANGIANGLKTLHDLGYAHLDVRLPNVCVSATFEVKLIDFDRATCVKSYKNTNFFMYTLEKEVHPIYRNYVEAGMVYDSKRLPSAEDYAKMLAVSPILLADQIKPPVLINLGAEDLRVPHRRDVSSTTPSRHGDEPLLVYPNDSHPISNVASDADSFVNSALWLHNASLLSPFLTFLMESWIEAVTAVISYRPIITIRPFYWARTCSEFGLLSGATCAPII
eukprot:Em0219g1a